jgi:hypothetical protein
LSNPALNSWNLQLGSKRDVEFRIRQWLFGEDARIRLLMLTACLITSVSCGSGKSAATTNGALSGNWQVALQRHGVPQPATYTGFLVQEGSSVTGNLILGGGCGGVGPVTGTVNGQNLTLNIDEFGQDTSLIGTLASGSAPMGGQFSGLAGACTAPFTTTGTWSAIPIPPLKGTFTGTLTSNITQGTSSSPLITQINGTLSQGPNTGDSTAALSGTVTATSPGSTFCAYLTTATITGLISGETVTLNLYGPDGSWISQVPASITPDGLSLSGTYLFQQISNSCTGDAGTLKLTFQ